MDEYIGKEFVMKANLERFPERGKAQRVLITSEFETACPRPMVEMIQPIVTVYGIEALGFVFSPNNPLKAWSTLNNVEVLEWARPEWMHSAIQAFNPTLILASQEDDLLMAEASEYEIPVLTFQES